RLEHRAVPALRPLLDLRDRHLLVAARHALDVLALGRGRLGLRLLLLRRLALRAAERDLEARRRRAEAGMALVARTAAVLADADLRPALVRDDRRRHLHAVVAEQDVRRERLAGIGGDAVHDERLPVADA